MSRATTVLLFAFATPLLAQQRSVPMPEPPKLPMIMEHACPFEGCSFREWAVIKDFDVFDTWKSPRKKLDTIRHGDRVLGETGVFVTWEPDRVRATRDVPALNLKSGDVYLRYMYEGEGFWDLWAAGVWYTEQDGAYARETGQTECKNCNAEVLSEGRKEWWVKVKKGKLEGWTLEENQFDHMDVIAEPDK
jgi:hypothetical protein